MLWEERIRQAMIDMASRHGPAQIVTGTVLDVDETQDTCTVSTVGGIELPDVQLRATVNPEEKRAWILVPAVGSEVLVGNIENGAQWAVLMVSEITKVRSEVGSAVFEVDGQKFQLSNGQENLSTLIGDLITAIRRMIFTTNVGPTIQLVNDPDFQSLQTRFNNLLK